MIHRLLLPLLLLIALAGPAAAQLVVVPGPDPGAARAEALLQFAGFTYHRLAPAAVTPEALAGARTVVLLHAPLQPAGAAALAQFAKAGGKLVLLGQEGPPELYQAVGVEARPAAPPARFDRIERAPAPSVAPGFPEVVRDVVTPALLLSPLPKTRVLAYRAVAVAKLAKQDGTGGGKAQLSIENSQLTMANSGTTSSPPAVTLAEGGAAISALFAPGDQWEKSWLLQAVLAAVDPELAEPAARGLRRQAGDAFAAAVAHWTRVRDRSWMTPAQREQRLRLLQALRAEWDGLRSVPIGPPPMAEAPRLQAFIPRARALDLGLTPSRPGEIRGVWIHPYSPTDWEQVARKVQAAGLNCLFARVGRGGNVIYPSALLPRDAWAEKAGGDEMQRAIDAAHRHGLKFFAWRVNFHMGSAPKAYRDRMAAEDRLVRDSHGVQADWANPGDPRNTELEFQVMREMVEKYNIDGIQLDYIRYPDAPSYDFDYGPISRHEFEKKLGHPVPNWPADVLSGPLKTAYEDWERENVNHLVERVYREVKRLKPEVQVSAAVWRSHRRYRAIIKQDWPLWVERHWLDLVVPMDYTPEPDTFAATVDAQVSLTRGRVPLAAGIGSWLLQTPEELVRQVEIAREAGAAGFVLFAYNAEQIEEQLAGLRAGATATDTWVPLLPAPLLRVTVASPAVAPKDTPLALRAGSPLQVRVEPGARASRPHRLCGRDARAPRDGFSLRLETPTGELIQSLGPVSPDQPTLLTGIAPAGRFQPVVRGVEGRSGREEPFVVRGPLVEGLPAVEIAALRAQERPPVFPAGGTGPRVGVYMGGLGAETVLTALAAQHGARAAAVCRLRPDHLAAVDVLILPQLADVAELDTPTQTRLRQWVEGGKTLILTHDAVGARWHPRLFPELVRQAQLSAATPLQTTVVLGGLPTAFVFRHRGSDQFRITPGPAGRALATEVVGIGEGPSATDGPAVVVSGRVSQGTVILVGFLSGYLQTELTADEARLLTALTRYRATPTGLKP